MTGKEQSPKTFTLELAGTASPHLSAAFESFLKEPERGDGTLRSLGEKAMSVIDLRSFQSAIYHEPRQIDRDMLGEDEGLAYGRYVHGLDTIARSKFKLSNDVGKSGVDDQGRPWLTLEPGSVVRDTVIVQPPLYPTKESPDLRMYIDIPEQERLSRAATLLALNALRLSLVDDELHRSDPDENGRILGRSYYVTRLRIKKTELPTEPAPEAQNELPKAA